MPEEQARGSRRGSRFRALAPALLLFVLVVVPRIGGAVATSDNFFSRGDLNWDATAVSFLEGDGLLIPHVGPLRTPMYAHKTPLFAFVLTGVYATVGRESAAVVFLQILFALAATAAVYALGKSLTGSRGAGYLAAVVTALHPPLVLHDVQLMESTLYRGLAAFLTLVIYRAGDSPRLRDLALVGAVAGITVLTRTTILFFLPLAAVWLLVRWWGHWRRHLPGAAVGIAVFLAVLSPWLVRNAAMFGRFHLVTGGGRSFYIGSSAQFLELFPETSVDVVENRLLRGRPRAEFLELRALDEMELDRVLMKMAMDDLRADPGRLPGLAALKLRAAFSPILNPTGGADAVDRRSWGVKALFHLISYGPLLVLGGLGMIGLLYRRPPAGSLLLLQFLAFATFTVLFWSHSRHRYFLDQFLAIGAAWLVWRLFLRRRERVSGSGEAEEVPLAS